VSGHNRKVTYAHEMLGLIAASLRMINHKTLDIPINGPSRFFMVVVNKPVTTRMYVATKPNCIRGLGSGAIMFAPVY